MGKYFVCTMMRFAIKYCRFVSNIQKNVYIFADRKRYFAIFATITKALLWINP